ncbi:MAG: hypothetical protein ACK4UP_07845 [Spirosomataceae bacterium]
MIYSFKDPRVKELEKGEFALPNLDWGNLTRPVPHTNVTSFHSIAFLMSKHGYEKMIEKFVSQMGGVFTPESAYAYIGKRISDYYLSQKTEDLEEIFHLIQLWGGNGSKTFYTQKRKLKIEIYEEFVRTIVSCESVFAACISVDKLVNQIPNFNITFAVKHVSIWQRFTPHSVLKLPFYDHHIAMNIMGRYTTNQAGKRIGVTNNHYRDLMNYWVKMLEVADLLEIDVLDIERHIYYFFREGENPEWNRFGKK